MKSQIIVWSESQLLFVAVSKVSKYNMVAIFKQMG